DFSRLGLKAGDRVLDLGCGEGRHAITAYLEGAVDVIGLDLSLADLGTAGGRFREFRDPTDASRSVNFACGSGLALPFRDATFDKVICAEVLEHIPDYFAMLKEIQRVLKPGGQLVVSVPRYGPEWICWQLSAAYHEVPGGHVRIFRRGELQRAVESVDMFCYARHWAHGLHSPYWWLRCLFWSRGEDVGVVRAYHRLLVWDLMQKPLLTRMLERLMNPLWGKSVVMYFVRGASRAS
ncbi:MAG TPA: class I SAM-dependent methyltransferase, partial [Pseudomonadales bacterium]